VFTFDLKKIKPHEPVILNFSPIVWLPFVFVNHLFLKEGRVCLIIQLFASSCPSLQSVACFLFIADVHLLTGCMAL
jgi:hypothetical protein